MNHLKKITGLSIIIIILCLSAAMSANADGFIFDWKSFVVDADLALGNPDKKALIKKLPAADISASIREDSPDSFFLSADQSAVSTSKSEKKSVLENIKIDFSPKNTYMTDRHEIYTHSDDEQITKFIDAMTSLIYDDSKIKSLETIGKIIQPQIKFYFEF
ncbi:MAG: hypothetical protein CVU55_14875 [Deltaproteobacteria bacterium HGW-Deltaproteobacteria-13]|jgi:hypothetical protein|nr:MAG: hypothetical protein CVU55_14875 [Deltaproteobacteria bacterium HGW-Deltaproteobacteria-13]